MSIKKQIKRKFKKMLKSKKVYLQAANKFAASFTLVNFLFAQLFVAGLFVIPTNASAVVVGNTVNIAPSKDAYVSQKSNEVNDNFGSAAEIKVKSDSSNLKRALVDFDLSSYSVHTNVSSATLYLFMNNAPGASRTYNIYPITAGWSESTVTWNNQPTASSTASGSIVTGTANNVWKSFNVTGDVQAFIGGTSTNYGWTIKDAAENSGNEEGKMRSKEQAGTTDDPYLAITYSCASGWTGTYCDTVVDTTAPTLSETTPVPTRTNDTTPNYSFSSDEAGTITYGGSCSSSTTAAVSGSNTITFNTLAEGTYTDCTVTVKDSSNNSSSPLTVSSFTIDTTAPSVVSVDSDGDTYSTNTSSPHKITIIFNEDVANTPSVDVHSAPTDPQTVTDCGDADATTFCFDYSITTPQTVTHTIYISGAEDAVGNVMTTNSSHTFNVDTTGPTLSFDDDVATGPVMADNVAVNFGDATVVKYGFVTSGSCSVSMDISSFVSYTTNFLISDASQNGNIVCVYGEDSLGNKSVLSSTNPFNIDITAPNITISNPDTNAAQSKTIIASTNEGTLYMIESSSTCDAEADSLFVPYASLTLTSESNNGQTVCYKAVDEAGNKKYSLSNAISGIDTTAPVVSNAYLTAADKVELTFNEDLQNNSEGHHPTTSDFKVYTGEVSYTISAVNYQDKKVTITLSDLVKSGDNPQFDVLPILTSVIDLAGNYFDTNSSYDHKVYDKVSPVITVPADITVETTDATGIVVEYTAPTATDVVDSNVTVTCDYNSGDKFVVGTTTVTCGSKDSSENTASKTFKVTVNKKETTTNGGGGGGGSYLPPTEPTLQIFEETINIPTPTVDSITITWNTSFAASSYVVYGSSSEAHTLNMSDTVDNPPKYGYAHATAEIDTTPKVTSHSITITGLEPATTYYFRTVSRGSLAVSEEHQFITPAIEAASTVVEEEPVSNTEEPQVAVVSTQDTTPVAQRGEQVAENEVVPTEEAVVTTEEQPAQQVQEKDDQTKTFFQAGLLGAFNNLLSFLPEKTRIPVLFGTVILLIAAYVIVVIVRKRKKT